MAIITPPDFISDFSVYRTPKAGETNPIRGKEGCVVMFQPSTGKCFHASTCNITHFITNTKSLLKNNRHTTKALREAYKQDKEFIWFYKVIRGPEAIYERQLSIQAALSTEQRLNTQLKIRTPTKW